MRRRGAGGDEAREAAHREKTVDVGMAAWRATGRVCTQREIARANGASGRVSDASVERGWWWDGRLTALELACKERVRTLARTVLTREVRLPGGHAMRDAAIEGEVVRHSNAIGKRRARSDDSEENSRAPRQRTAAGSSSGATENEAAAPAVEATRTLNDATSPATGGAAPDAAPTAAAFNAGLADGEEQSELELGRGKRKREDRNYDEVSRRGAKRQRAVYLSVKGRRTGAKRDAIQAGVATLERTVGGRYRWRDTNLTAAKRRRGRVLFERSGTADDYVW